MSLLAEPSLNNPPLTRQVVPQLRQERFVPVATRTAATYKNGLSNGTVTAGTSRVAHFVTATCRGLRVGYANIYNTNGGAPLDGPNAITVRMAVEDPNGKLHRGWCNGARDVVIPPGGIAWFDVDGAFAAGDRIFTRTHVSVANAGEKWPLSITTNTGATASIGEGNNYGAPGADLTTSGTVPATFAFAYAPAAILAQPLSAVVTVGLVGDSVTQGQGDTADLGYAIRAINAAGLGYVNLAQNGEAAFQYADPATSGDTRQHTLKVTHVIEAYGVNDIFNNARTLAQIQSSCLLIWNDLARRGIKTWRTTISPKTTSTDGWATVAGQTIDAATGIRNSFNDWIRDGAPILNGAAAATGSTANGTVRAGQTGHPLAGYFEVADTVESARNSGKWKTTGRAVADGAMASSSTTLTSATAAFTAADVGTAVRVAGAGASGALLDTTIASITDGATAVLATAATTAVSAAAVGIGIKTYTVDGTHPHGGASPLNPAGLAHLAMASAIDPSRFTLAA